MPIYEYRCQSCGHTLDALQKISDPHLTDCPDCGKSALKRLMSAPSFRLKGGGWYETDFKTGNKKNLAGGADAATSSGSTATPAASSKPASTSTGDSK
jgi:putative FmdB family regulatory protein